MDSTHRPVVPHFDNIETFYLTSTTKCLQGKFRSILQFELQCFDVPHFDLRYFDCVKNFSNIKTLVDIKNVDTETSLLIFSFFYFLLLRSGFRDTVPQKAAGRYGKFLYPKSRKGNRAALFLAMGMVKSGQEICAPCM